MIQLPKQFMRPLSSPSPSRPRLPRLPIPPLRKTLDRYLKSIQPFLLEDEAHGGAPFSETYALRVRWAEEFESGVGTLAQDRLQALDKNPLLSPHNWLDDNIWLKKAYHEWRAPLPVNSNWWLTFLNDENVPEAVRRIPEGSTDDAGYTEIPSSPSWAGVTSWQVRRAAWLVSRILDFKERMGQTNLTPQTRTPIWLRDSTRKIFGTCRIPGIGGCDSLSPYSSLPVMNGDNTVGGAAVAGHGGKLLVMVHDWFYAVECYHPQPWSHLDSTSENSSALSSLSQSTSPSSSGPASPSSGHEHQQEPEPTARRVVPAELERRLRCVARDAAKRLASGERAIPVGVLSSDGRDRWAENYEHLRTLSTNVRTFEVIHQSLFALSLDHYTYTLPPSSPPSPASSPPTTTSTRSNPSITEPPDLTPHLHQVRSPPDAHNRWYDKPLTIIVESNTRAGAMGEHSPVDALVPSVVCEYAVVTGVDGEVMSEGVGAEEEVGVEGWERLEWVVDERIERECRRAEQDARALIADSDDSGLWFTDYGADWIKDVAKLSPDAYIQMAFQLAWYQTRGEFTATYETALTRMFAHGRTETIRTLTADCRAWVLSMVDRETPQATRLRLLQRALKTHASLTREAATGRGIDRHLLGLRLMLAEVNDGSRPKLFEDELFERGQTWKLSTSGLSAGHHFRGTGFGAPYQDGYGINYMTGPDVIKFGIESKHSCPLTSTDGFKAAISGALQEMKSICSAGLESSNTVVSHL